MNLIAGADLASRTLDPGKFVAFVGGRLKSLFVKSDQDLGARLSTLDERRDPDARFRVNEFFCQNDTWQTTLQQLLRRSEVVLMDLRGFCATNSGCLFELKQLADHHLLPRTLFIVDEATDVPLLETTVRNQIAEKPGTHQASTELSLNLAKVSSQSAAELSRIAHALHALVAG